ncbi:MAG: hypothetical protein AAF654_08170 [Myxococcota bacterium]
MTELTEIRHGRLRMNVPRTWRDTSELAFESPPQKLMADPRRPEAGKDYKNNVHVTFEDRASHLTSPADYLDVIANTLKQQGMVTVEIRRFELGDSPTPRLGVERRVNTRDGWVRQVGAVSLYPDVAVVATASTIEPSDEETLRELHELVGSIRLD